LRESGFRLTRAPRCRDVCYANGCSWTGKACAANDNLYFGIFSSGVCPATDPACFPGSATFVSQSGQVKRVDELVHGDLVPVVQAGTGAISYSPVKLFMHVERTQNYSFVRLEHGDARHAVEMSADHRIFVSSTPLDAPVDVMAGQVRVGDYLWAPQVADKQQRLASPVADRLVASRVRAVSTVDRQGLFAFATDEGTIIMDNTMSSVFSSDGSFGLSQEAMTWRMQFHEVFHVSGLIPRFSPGELPPKVDASGWNPILARWKQVTNVLGLGGASAAW
jgi:hypothetical protein